MNRIWIVLSAIFLASCCYAGDESWQIEGATPFSSSFLLDMPSSDLKATVSVDVSEAVKSLSFLFQPTSGNNKFAIGLLSKEDGYRKAFALRAKYSLYFNILEWKNIKFGNESDLAVGLLNGAYPMKGGDSRFEFVQTIFGLRDGFIAQVSVGDSQFGARTGADVSVARLSDDYGNETAWDSFGVRYGVFAKSQFSENVFFRINADGWRKKYNPDNYFFVEKWASETKVLAETTFLLNKNVELIPAIGYHRFDLERDQRADLERAEYGGRLVYKTSDRYDTKLFFNGIYAPWRHKSGSENLISVGVESNGLSAEVFQRQTNNSYSTFEIKERVIGARLAWKFGGTGRKDLDAYGKVVEEKYSFYRDSGIKDNTSLTMTQQAERLRTIRKQGEWENNLIYKKATDNGWGFRYADEVYSGRAGDCDEQSCAGVTMSALEGNPGYTVAWWDLEKSYIGHGAAIIQDPTNGQWFFREYGMTYKVNVDPNAPLTEVAKAAIRQNHMYSALPVSGSTDADYVVIDCSDGKSYEWLTGFLPLGSLDSVKKRPNVEYGMELFTKRDFLFEY